MTRFLCIACEVLARPIYLSAAYSPHVIDIELIHRGLHNEPARLQSEIQEHINRAEGKGYQAILLGYGLCGNGTAGLISRSIPLVLPRVHDCISLLLGDPQRYLDQFEQSPGTYWYSQDFLERNDESNKFSSLGPISDEALSKQYDLYVTKYGKDNADYLMETMSSWQTHYQQAAFIDMQITNVDHLERKVQEEAKKRGWIYEKLAGDMVLFRQLLNGEWFQSNPSAFIEIPPNQVVDLTYDKTIFRCDLC